MYYLHGTCNRSRFFLSLQTCLLRVTVTYICVCCNFEINGVSGCKIMQLGINVLVVVRSALKMKATRSTETLLLVCTTLHGITFQKTLFRIYLSHVRRITLLNSVIVDISIRQKKQVFLLREGYLTKFRIVLRTLLDATVGCFSTFLQT